MSNLLGAYKSSFTLALSACIGVGINLSVFDRSDAIHALSVILIILRQEQYAFFDGFSFDSSFMRPVLLHQTDSDKADSRSLLVS